MRKLSQVTSPARHRDVTWEDPLVGAALARDLSGPDYLLGIAEGRIPPAPIAVLLGMSIVAVEPGHAEEGVPDDQQAPPLPHDVEALRDRAPHVLETRPLHDLSIVGCVIERTISRLSFMRKLAQRAAAR